MGKLLKQAHCTKQAIRTLNKHTNRGLRLLVIGEMQIKTQLSSFYPQQNN